MKRVKKEMVQVENALKNLRKEFHSFVSLNRASVYCDAMASALTKLYKLEKKIDEKAPSLGTVLEYLVKERGLDKGIGLAANELVECLDLGDYDEVWDMDDIEYAEELRLKIVRGMEGFLREYKADA